MEFHLFCACSSERFAFFKIRFHLWLCVSATVWLSLCGDDLVRAEQAGGTQSDPIGEFFTHLLLRNVPY